MTILWDTERDKKQAEEIAEKLREYIKHNCIYPPQTSVRLFKKINEFFGIEGKNEA